MILVLASLPPLLAETFYIRIHLHDSELHLWTQSLGEGCDTWSWMLTRWSHCCPKTGRHKCWFCRLKPESITTSSKSTADHREGPDHIWKYYTDRQNSSTPGKKTNPFACASCSAAQNPFAVITPPGLLICFVATRVLMNQKSSQQLKREKKILWLFTSLKFDAQTWPDMKLSSGCIPLAFPGWSRERKTRHPEIIF